MNGLGNYQRPQGETYDVSREYCQSCKASTLHEKGSCVPCEQALPPRDPDEFSVWGFDDRGI